MLKKIKIILLLLFIFGLFVLLEAIPNYNRKEWRHWIRPVSGDCKNIRHTILAKTSLIPVRYATQKKCRITTGKWYCPYIGIYKTQASEIDIDHHVPLKEAHNSGGYLWNKRTKRQYANDITNNYHLIPICRKSNRSKSYKDISKWLPKQQKCTYVANWKKVKKKYNLKMDRKERNAIRIIEKQCSSGALKDSDRSKNYQPNF